MSTDTPRTLCVCVCKMTNCIRKLSCERLAGKSAYRCMPLSVMCASLFVAWIAAKLAAEGVELAALQAWQQNPTKREDVGYARPRSAPKPKAPVVPPPEPTGVVARSGRNKGRKEHAERPKGARTACVP